MKNEKRKTIRLRIGPVGEAILATVVVAGAIPLFALFPGLAMVIAPFMRKKKYSSKQAVERNVESLVRSGLLKKTISSNGSVKLSLTRKGKWEAFLRSKSHDTTHTEWDKTWRVVIFDVPQAKYKMRDELRRAMKLFGFKRIQLSVWVYPYPCDDFIEILKKYLGVTNDVLYMKVSYIENDMHLRREFSLK